MVAAVHVNSDNTGINPGRLNIEINPQNDRGTRATSDLLDALPCAVQFDKPDGC